jgi:hypothetical protein
MTGRNLVMRLALAVVAAVMLVAGPIMTASAQAGPLGTVTRCAEHVSCFDQSMHPLNENGLNARMGLLFHRHTANGSSVTLESLTVNIVSGPPCFYTGRVVDGKGVDRPIGNNCNHGIRLNFAVDSATAVLTIQATRVDPSDHNGEHSLHHLAVRDFCSQPPFCRGF